MKTFILHASLSFYEILYINFISFVFPEPNSFSSNYSGGFLSFHTCYSQKEIELQASNSLNILFPKSLISGSC